MPKLMSPYLLLPVFFFVFACTPQPKTKDPLSVSGQQWLSSSDILSRGLPTSADVKAYPKAIAQAEEVAAATVDSRAKGQAHLSLMVLHLNRANPDQDFNAASDELDLAVQADPALLTQPSVQRWLDVFSRLNAMRKGYEVAEMLRQENQTLRISLDEKDSKIRSLSTTLKELNRMELDVEKKRRLYR